MYVYAETRRMRIHTPDIYYIHNIVTIEISKLLVEHIYDVYRMYHKDMIMYVTVISNIKLL